LISLAGSFSSPGVVGGTHVQLEEGGSPPELSSVVQLGQEALIFGCFPLLMEGVESLPYCHPGPKAASSSLFAFPSSPLALSSVSKILNCTE
jgi:hypothetical protein